MSKKFIKKIEDFVCENCKTKVKGSGYTNHCPKCLFSKHVDLWPGDRQEKCGGLMEPTGLELKNGRYILTHTCLKCGKKQNCKTSEIDSIEALERLSESIAKKTFF